MVQRALANEDLRRTIFYKLIFAEELRPFIVSNNGEFLKIYRTKICRVAGRNTSRSSARFSQREEKSAGQ